MQAITKIIPVLILFLGLLPRLQAETASGKEPQIKPRTIIQLEIADAIGPATSDYIVRNLDKAAEAGAVAVLIRIDTPGGLDSAMRQIIKKIIASPVPVISYVAPGGARAASAGTYILYASHIAAMAPATNLGAATPVQIGGLGGLEEDKKKSKKTDKPESSREKPIASDNPMTRKMVNDAVAYIRGLAKMRGRNADWAEKAVTEAASLPAEEALALNVIDLIATDQADLLRQLDGREINILGQKITLKTSAVVVNRIVPDWRSELLSVITNPNIAYVLMLIGIYGLFFEFSNPGSIVPGTIGGICLLLAMYAFQVLPVNYAGMALIILGIALMMAEAFVPSFGILGLGGVAAFVIGSVILMDTDAPGFGINIGLVGGFALSSAAFFILALGMLFRSRGKPVVSGREQMIGATGAALEDFQRQGMIRIHSENWRARTDKAIQKNTKVRVIGMEGLTLIVTPSDNDQEESQ